MANAPQLPEGMAPKEPPKKHHGLFGSKEAPAVPAAGMADLSSQLNNISRRLRVLEERYTNLRKKTQVSDQNMLKFNKTQSRELKAMDSEVVDFRREFLDLKDKIKLIVKELKDCAKSDQVMVLEKYINLWEPANFVTRNEVERIIEQKMNGGK